MSKVESINDLVLKELKNEILDAIDEAKYIIKKLGKGHPSIYMCLAEIDAYKHVIDMINKRLKEGVEE